MAKIRINRLYGDPTQYGCISSKNIGSKAGMVLTAKSTSEGGLSSLRACCGADITDNFGEVDPPDIGMTPGSEI